MFQTWYVRVSSLFLAAKERLFLKYLYDCGDVTGFVQNTYFELNNLWNFIPGLIPNGDHFMPQL